MAQGRMTVGRWVVAGVALLLHLVIGFYFLATGLVAPLWAVALLLLVWLVLLVQGWRHRSRPGFVLAMPLVAACVWYLVVQGGSWLFGWTA